MPGRPPCRGSAASTARPPVVFRLCFLATLVAMAGPTGATDPADSLGTPTPADSTIDLFATPFEDLLVFSLNADLGPRERQLDLGVSFLVPGSETVRVDGALLLPERDYRLDAELGRLELFETRPGSRLELSALRRPVAFPRLFARNPLLAWRDLAGGPEDAELRPDGATLSGGSEAARTATLSLGGSKSLVLRMGSGEDIALEQSLRLNLQGWLSDSTRVEAVLRDDELPFQPEGNTERLEELDKVYLRIQGPAGRAQVGDFVFAARKRELTPFQRDFQGIEGDWAGALGGASVWLAQSRGLFRSEEFYGEDGLQGPYELLSALRGDGAVILAGSEQVFLGGRRLTRGRDRDYTIDYDLGTLTFTTRVPVSAGEIIRVDFRYSQESWRRGAWGAGARSRLGPLVLDFLHFQERDDPENPLAFPLDDERRVVLAAAGDDPERAITSGVSQRPGEGHYVLTHENPEDPAMDTYAWVDSLGDYDLRFRELGTGLGDYQTVGVSDTGERIFAYVGEGQGAFALGERLQSPEGYRLESLRLDLFTDAVSAEVELALSDRDANLLSDLGDGDNTGLAFLARGEGSFGAPAGRDLSMALAAERLGEDFRHPGRRRGALQYRDWNLPWDPGPGEEERLEAELSWGRPREGGAAFRAEVLRLGERFDGVRGSAELGGIWRGLAALASLRVSDTSDSLLGDGRRDRAFFDLALPLPLLRGLELERERAALTAPDSLDSQRVPEQRGNFTREGATLKLGGGEARWPWSLAWGEERIESGADRTRQRRVRAGLRSSLPAGGSLDLSGLYRHRRDQVEGEGGAEASDQFQTETRLTWLARPGSWGGEGLYRLGSQRQRLRQSRLVFVGEGQGDLNEDGVFVGQGEGDYRRLFLLADEALRTLDLGIEARVVHEEDRGGSILRRIGSETRLSLREQTRSEDIWGLARLDPALFQDEGRTLLGSLELRQELRYRLVRAGLGLRYRYRHRNRMDARDAAGGTDELEGEHRLRLRGADANGSAQLVLRRAALLRRGREGSGGGDYDVSQWGGQLAWTRHLAPWLSATLGGGYARGRDADRELSLREIELEPALSLSPIRSLRFDVAWQFKHSEYQAGDPATGRPWFFDAPGWERTLRVETTAQAGGNLTLSARYELREEADRPRRHRLRMESRAFF